MLLPAALGSGVGAGEGERAFRIFLQPLECLADGLDADAQGLGQGFIAGAGLPRAATGAADGIEIGGKAQMERRGFAPPRLAPGRFVQSGFEPVRAVEETAQLGVAALEFLERELAAVEVIAAIEDAAAGGTPELVELGGSPADLRIDLDKNGLALRG